MRSFLPFGGAGHDGTDGLRQLVCWDSLECRRDAKKHAPQVRRLKQRSKQPRTTYAMRAELEAREYPRALDGSFDVTGKIGQRGGTGWQAGQGRCEVFLDGLRVDLVVPADAVQIAVVELPELVNPVRQFDIGIAAQLGKCGGGLNAAKQGEVELAEQRSPRDRHCAMCRAACTPCSIESSARPPVAGQIPAFFFPTSRPLCFLEWARFWRLAARPTQHSFYQ
ncbi:hypothetical protein BKP43_16470 [Variovorax boronicumulans]|nr:hypothetical protein BKP43_16470 [Variovorax boronicumulans]